MEPSHPEVTSENRPWEADPSALFERRLGKTAQELGNSQDEEDCPDIWQLSNGDIAVISRDLTADYSASLPAGVSLAADERLVVIPGNMLSAAKRDIPDA
ncbi:hypothetical protein [Streptomyces sp. NPDC050428]|uniref:hypothetical protein n=1 Tax=Streptomyces sp. NPDC050428 TaxID=3155757 RepID=UPI003446E494